MRIAMGHVDEYSSAVGSFARQLGLSGVQLHDPSNLRRGQSYWTLDDFPVPWASANGRRS